MGGKPVGANGAWRYSETKAWLMSRLSQEAESEQAFTQAASVAHQPRMSYATRHLADHIGDGKAGI